MASSRSTTSVTSAAFSQQPSTRRRSDQGGATGRGQQSFGFPIDNLQFQPEFIMYARQKIRSIGGRAAGLGGDQARASHPPIAHLVPANRQRLDGALDSAFA